MKTRHDVSAMLRLKARGWGLKRIAVKLRCSPEHGASLAGAG